MSKSIPQEVKNKVYEATQDVYEQDGNVELSRVQNVLVEDYGVVFFNTPILEQLVKTALENKIYAYC